MRYSYDHVHLQTNDLDATVAWFERMFDARRLWIGEFKGTKITHLGFHGTFVNVFHRPPTNRDVTPEDAIIHHFAMRPDDYDAAIADLKRRGARFHTEPAAVGPHLQRGLHRRTGQPARGDHRGRPARGDRPGVGAIVLYKRIN